jgi:hypothetical protein
LSVIGFQFSVWLLSQRDNKSQPGVIPPCSGG